MGHPDEGLIRAFLDGEAGGDSDEVGAHLERCPQCARLAENQEATLALLPGALALLDMAPPTDRAHRRALARGRSHSWSWVRQNLPRAASFAVLITAGAAAALPGSPVRHWVADGWAALSGDGSSSVTAGTSSSTAPSPEPGVEAGLVGATIALGAGEISLRLEEMAPGAEISVRLVDGDRVGLFAGEGTRFRTENGSIEATGAPGTVTVEIPSQTPSAVLLVEGVVYLRMRGGHLEVLGPVTQRTPTEIRFGGAPPSSHPTP